MTWTNGSAVRASAVASELALYAGCLPASPFCDYVNAAATAGFDAITKNHPGICGSQTTSRIKCCGHR